MYIDSFTPLPDFNYIYYEIYVIQGYSKL